MEVRKKIFEDDFVNSYCNYLIDSRTGGLFANVFQVNMKRSEERNYYKSTLHTDAEAAPLPCSGQSICDVSMAVSAEIIGRYRTLIMKKEHLSLHSFHDYSTGQSYIVQANKYILGSDKETTIGSILKVGTEAENPERR